MTMVAITDVGIVAGAATTSTPNNAAHGVGTNEFGLTQSFYSGHAVNFIDTVGFYCDKLVPAASGCEMGTNYKVAPAKKFDPLYITVPVGFSVPAMSMNSRRAWSALTAPEPFT